MSQDKRYPTTQKRISGCAKRFILNLLRLVPYMPLVSPFCILDRSSYLVPQIWVLMYEVCWDDYLHFSLRAKYIKISPLSSLRDKECPSILSIQEESQVFGGYKPSILRRIYMVASDFYAMLTKKRIEWMGLWEGFCRCWGQHITFCTMYVQSSRLHLPSMTNTGHLALLLLHLLSQANVAHTK